MNIENDVFKKSQFDFEKLISYGFIKENDKYIYSQKFMNNFNVQIAIDTKGIVTGKIIDIKENEEYINYRIEGITGEYVNKVKEEYIKLLEDIKKKCTNSYCFITKQANEITALIEKEYGDTPIFAWDKYPGFGLFKNPINGKWYGLIVNIDKSKLESTQSGEIEIINLKLDAEKIQKLLTLKGYYPAYHMNKKNWISIILDNTISNELLMEYIRESHSYTDKDKTKKGVDKKDLLTIPNIGKSIKEDLINIGIKTVEDLKNKNPEELYEQSCKVKGFREDRCLLYVFRMAVYYAENETHEEDKLKWWNWKD